METTPITQKKRIYILNVPVDILQPEAIEDIVTTMASDKEVHQIVLITLIDLMRARRKSDFLACLNKATLVLPVSPVIVRAAAFLKREKPVRYMPFEFTIRLLGCLEKKSETAYLLGQREAELLKIENNLKGSFPKLRIVGRCPGYFLIEREADILLAIKKTAPSLLLAGRGVPGNNVWLHFNRNKLNPGIFLWSEECFDIFSGKRQKISKGLWKSRFYFLPDLLKRPWYIFGIFLRVYYWIVLLIHRIWKL